jgi:DNA mismatch repair protein MutH
MELDYDPSSKKSILATAKKLTGKTLNESCTIPPEIQNKANKGDLGTLVENYFFGINPGNSAAPDFPEAGLELKTTGLIRRKDGSLKAKERLVLTSLNYMLIVKETWLTSTFLKKCSSMLLLFYEYVKETSVIDRKFIIDPMIYELPPEDLPQIKRDWEAIQRKIMDGKAHELSEGDTFYLGACRKGSGGPDEKLLQQPFSNTLAKSRAFSFKPSYLDAILNAHLSGLPSLGASQTQSIEEATYARFSPFLGMTIDEISSRIGYWKSSVNHKSFNRVLAERILASNGSNVRELIKAGIQLKTVVLQPSGTPKESMSFDVFDFLSIGSETWENSSFCSSLEQKFLFVVFQDGKDGVRRLVKVAYWNMPFDDREEARKVWELTKKRVSVDVSNLPKTRDSHVAHVRPKGRDGNDKALTPQGTMHLKQCFWLNAKYIGNVIGSL